MVTIVDINNTNSSFKWIKRVNKTVDNDAMAILTAFDQYRRKKVFRILENPLKEHGLVLLRHQIKLGFIDV
ncbi:MAG: hypothetical protein MZV70_42030 [Desulfobacterales bacterium]|nr:hypothetical protein [Desulfobacterales bacterium]